VIRQSINGVVVCGDLDKSPTQTKVRSDYSINIQLCFPSDILIRKKKLQCLNAWQGKGNWSQGP